MKYLLLVLALGLTACDTSRTKLITENDSAPDKPIPTETVTPVDDTNQENDPVNVDSDPVTDNSVCVVSSLSLGTAKDAYEAECRQEDPDRYRDCDEYPQGGWACASAVIGAMGPDGSVGTTPYFEPKPPIDIVIIGDPIDEPVDDPDPVVVVVPDPVVDRTLSRDVEETTAPGWKFVTLAGHEGSGALMWDGANKFGQPGDGTLGRPGDGLLLYTFDIPVAGDYEITIRSHITDGPTQSPQASDKNNDVFIKVGSAGWQKAFHQTRGQWHDTLPITKTLDAGTLTIQLSGRSKYFVIDTLNVEPINSTPVVVSGEGDLIIANADAAPDPDDLQYLLAADAVFRKLGITNYEVVVGSYGHQIGHRFIEGAVEHGRSIFGEVTDAHNDRAGAVSFIRQRITDTLDSGFAVSIAEGGPSDFTYAVLSGINGRDLQRVTIVQHAPAFNEGQTKASSLAWLKANTNYVNIGNGNHADNTGTADFQQARSTSQCQSFVNAALSSNNSSQWAYAFSLEVDERYCDFSDTVELLHIVGDSVTRTLSDFNQNYIQ